MRYVFLGGTGLKVSELCLGTASFGVGTPVDASKRIWSRCVDAGVNFFDTADAAPEGEKLLGAWARGQRHALVISTKVFRPTGLGPNDAGLTRKHIVQACEGSSRRMDTEYIDLYLAHSDDFLTPMEETLSAFDQLVRQGKVLYIGGSNYGAWRFNEALWTALVNNYSRYCCVQALYNIQARDIEVDLLPMCVQKGLGVLAWSPLAQGALTDAVAAGASNARGTTHARPEVRAVLADVAAQASRPLAQVALRWALSRRGVDAVAVGASTVRQIEENLGVCDFQLAPKHMAILDAASAPPLPYPAALEPLARELRRAD